MIRLIILFALLFAATNAVIAENRIAFVVGNANYASGDNLPNDLNDADDIATILDQYRFKIINKKDAKLEDILDGLKEFQNELEKGGVGLFYYSGHGLEVDGQQYIVPIDAKPLKSKIELPYYLIDVNSILKVLGESKTQLNIIILDACRDNPFAKALGMKSSLRKGFSPIVNVPNGTLIASATAVGDTSSGSGDRNSVYTEQLLKFLREKPDIEIRLLLGDVGDAVKTVTNNDQVPWIGGSMSGRFYFVENNPESPTIRIEAQNNSIDDLYGNGVSKFKFGSSAEEINSQLTPPFGNVNWNLLPIATEYKKAEVRYFFRPLSEFYGLPFQDLYNQCSSDGSYLLFMFENKRLFNISLRFSEKCPVSRRVVEQITNTYGFSLVPNGREVKFKYKGEKVLFSGSSSSNWFSAIDWSTTDSGYPPL